jgi:hypothetical protein
MEPEPNIHFSLLFILLPPAISKEIKFSDYLLSRMLMPEKAHGSIPEELLCCQNKANTHFLPVNRFQMMARLGQTYLVDMTSRAIDTRLSWQNQYKAHMFGGVFSDESGERNDDQEDDNGNDAGNDDEEARDSTYMNSSGKLKTQPTFLVSSI